MNSYFSMSETLYDITERYPALISYLSGLGFAQLQQEALRKRLGKTITLETALKSRGLDSALVEAQMTALLADETKKHPVRMEALLPCPIRVPIAEALKTWANEHQIDVDFNLQAASMGVARMKEHIDAAADADALPDLYLSAGYGLFFDPKAFERFPEDLFVRNDLSLPLAPRFDSEACSLRDPSGRFHIIGIVPAVFAVNLSVLEGRAVPERWSDLMKPEYENSAAIPVQDADLFDAIMLSIWARYGEDGLRALGRSSRKSMHPAQMVKAASGKNTAPLVSIVPYFFAQMMEGKPDMRIVWPKDGAILNPIFVMAKNQKAISEQADALLSYLCSDAFGALLSTNGRFPSTLANVDSHLSAAQDFLWPDFSVLNRKDLPELLKHAADVFLSA